MRNCKGRCPFHHYADTTDSAQTGRIIAHFLDMGFPVDECSKMIARHQAERQNFLALFLLWYVRCMELVHSPIHLVQYAYRAVEHLELAPDFVYRPLLRHVHARQWPKIPVHNHPGLDQDCYGILLAYLTDTADYEEFVWAMLDSSGEAQEQFVMLAVAVCLNISHAASPKSTSPTVKLARNILLAHTYALPLLAGRGSISLEDGYIKDKHCTRDNPVVLGLPQKNIYGKGIRLLPRVPSKQETKNEAKHYLRELLPLEAYDVFVVLFSGGKDSLACYLRLLEMGVPKEKIQIWHHDIDGGHPTRRMDWPVTSAYVKAFAEAEGVKLVPSWRINGFYGELYRLGSSYPVEYEADGEVKTCPLSPPQQRSEKLREKILQELIEDPETDEELRDQILRELTDDPDAYKEQRELLLRQHVEDTEAGQALKKLGYRMKFPAKSGDLARRWCSAALKIDVSKTVLRNLDLLEELEKEGKVKKFPAKGAILNGRWCSVQLKRTIGESVIRHIQIKRTVDEKGKIRLRIRRPIGKAASDYMEQLELEGWRTKFPAKSGPHQGRWCSGKMKASVYSSVTADLAATKKDVKILVVSGERRGESAGRSQYNEMELHPTHATARAKRLVHQWRAVIDHSERDVWEIIRRHKVKPHPCYTAGWNRCSCACCIFGLPKHWAGIRELFPEYYQALKEDEQVLGFTIDNKKSLDEYVGDVKSCVVYVDMKAIRQLKTGVFTTADVYAQSEGWTFPAGAFGGADGGPC